MEKGRLGNVWANEFPDIESRVRLRQPAAPPAPYKQDCGKPKAGCEQQE
jgi:hypothetical protein